MSTNIFQRQAITVYPKESQRSGFVLQADLDLWGWRRMRKPYCLAELHKIT